MLARPFQYLVLILTISALYPIYAQTGAPASYELLRYEESYRDLADSSSSDPWDAVKYIGLGPNPNTYLTLGGDMRQAFEHFRNQAWMNSGSNSYWLQRYRLLADLHLSPRFRLYTELASSLAVGRTGGPRPIDENQFYLYQVFADLRLLPNTAWNPTLRVGRQILSLGDARLVSPVLGVNVQQAFDGVRLLAGALPDQTNVPWQLTTFALRAVHHELGVLDDPVLDDGQQLWGAYGTWMSFQPQVDIYYLGYERSQAEYFQGAGRELRHTIGVRLFSPPQQTIDYDHEFMYQIGSYGAGDISAWAVSLNAGYNWLETKLKPRLGLRADMITGDRNPSDPDLQTFNPLFLNAVYYGWPGSFTAANLMTLASSIRFTFPSQSFITLDYTAFWRQQQEEGIYAPGQLLTVPPVPSNEEQVVIDRFVGHQLAIIVDLKISRHVGALFTYNRFLTGPFLEAVSRANDRDYLRAHIIYQF